MLTHYKNPVFDQYLADPFVLQHEGHYYAYGTGPRSPEGRAFPVLHSTDLVNWQSQGWSLIPPGGDDFWAPEVAFYDGVFYMYYSAHGIDGKDHQLRVATQRNPLGPFRDAGRVLVPDQPFSIDAHPFQDQDGQWYLFYSQDFLTINDPYRVGTGIVVDRMLDMFTLAGEPRVVIRPHADWQLFKAQRSMYGAVYDWHTIEGAALRFHNDHYYCFYSGGAWEHDNYGISYVVADHVLGPYRLPSENQPILLRSVPGHVIGPGHNSFTKSPNGEQEYVVYHAWDPGMTARRMCIDSLYWVDGIPVIHGPTWTPQPLAESNQ
ncbi:MAG: glycoside hydrolase family 43 protein [Anaerolineales bacterium]